MGQVCFKNRGRSRRRKVLSSKKLQVKSIIGCKNPKKINKLLAAVESQKSMIKRKIPVLKNVSTQTDDELIFSYILEKKKKYEEMSMFFSQMNGAKEPFIRSAKEKRSLVLDKLSLQNSSIYQIERNKHIHDASQKDISVILKSEDVRPRNDFVDVKIMKKNSFSEKKILTEEHDSEAGNRNSRHKGTGDISAEVSNERRSRNERLSQKLDVVKSDKTRKKILNKTTTLGVNDRFLSKKNKISISFEHHKDEAKVAKCKTPEIRNRNPQNNRISRFAASKKRSEGANSNRNYKRKLRKYTVVEKSSNQSRNRHPHLNFEYSGAYAGKSDPEFNGYNGWIHKSSDKQYRQRRSFMVVRKDQGKSLTPKSPASNLVKNNRKLGIKSSKLRKQGTMDTNFLQAPQNNQCGRSRTQLMNDFQKSYFSKKNIKKEQHRKNPRNYQRFQRFHSIGFKGKNDHECDSKDIENLFKDGKEEERSSDFSSNESSMSSDIKEAKKSIVRDMEMSMLAGMSRNDID